MGGFPLLQVNGPPTLGCKPRCAAEGIVEARTGMAPGRVERSGEERSGEE